VFHLTIVNVAALNRTLCGIGNRRKSYFLTPGIVNSIVSYDQFEIGFKLKVTTGSRKRKTVNIDVTFTRRQF
jgi:hypothetical protein